MNRGFAKTGLVEDFDPDSYSHLIGIMERYCSADEDANRRANSKNIRNYILGDIRIGLGYDPAKKDGQLLYWIFGKDEEELKLLEKAISKERNLHLN